jgi:hypothetical protein
MRICREVLARIFVQEPVDRALGWHIAKAGGSALSGIRPCVSRPVAGRGAGHVHAG